MGDFGAGTDKTFLVGQNILIGIGVKSFENIL
jgi:hypothetical protein